MAPRRTEDEASADPSELPTALRDLAWTIHRLVPEVASLDPLPNTELAVVKQVLGSPGITVSELAGRLGMRHSNVSAAVRGLIGRGLVARESDPSDRRVTKLAPTEKSTSARESIDTRWSGTVRNAMDLLSDEHVAAIEAASGALRALDEALHEERDQRGHR
ncbi:MarR family winged helix-turn-helix transcriptional regulator [Saccharopolyspora gloriosae]|uniref:MarR family winged helix-turn-helix transcriptional regulator n=1 Tax=Saccharopolyspora gloriosae TaxID=455344 RepID=UPI001FB63FD7|nr:MarR family transcriptional regulator [Saccharopolyspora gloriosae]